MHLVIAALGILTAVYFFVIRARGAAEMTSELIDMAADVRAAARRLGFRPNGDRLSHRATIRIGLRPPY